MSIDIPPSLDWLFEITVGQAWPRGDEDKLRAVGTAWETAQQQLGDLADQISPAAQGVLSSISGDTADQFAQFVNQLQGNIPALADGAGQLSQFSNQAALSVETTKYMMLAQMIWMAEQIAEWSATIWGLVLVPEIEAIGRLIVNRLARQLIESIITSIIAMVGIDAAIQGIEMLKGDRTHWDTGQLVESLELGALAGAISGLTHIGGGIISPAFTKSLLGHMGLGALDGALTAEAADGIFGMNLNPGFAAAAGATMGAIGKLKTIKPGDEEIDPPNLGNVRAPNLTVPHTGPVESGSSGPDTRPGGGGGIDGGGGNDGGGLPGLDDGSTPRPATETSGPSDAAEPPPASEPTPEPAASEPTPEPAASEEPAPQAAAGGSEPVPEPAASGPATLEAEPAPAAGNSAPPAGSGAAGGARTPEQRGAAITQYAIDHGLPEPEAQQFGNQFTQAHQNNDQQAVTDLNQQLGDRIDHVSLENQLQSIFNARPVRQPSVNEQIENQLNSLTPQQHGANVTQYAADRGLPEPEAQQFGNQFAQAHGNEQATSDLNQQLNQRINEIGSGNSAGTGSSGGAVGSGSGHASPPPDSQGPAEPAPVRQPSVDEQIENQLNSLTPQQHGANITQYAADHGLPEPEAQQFGNQFAQAHQNNDPQAINDLNQQLGHRINEAGGGGLAGTGGGAADHPAPAGSGTNGASGRPQVNGNGSPGGRPSGNDSGPSAASGGSRPPASTAVAERGTGQPPVSDWLRDQFTQSLNHQLDDPTPAGGADGNGSHSGADGNGSHSGADGNGSHSGNDDDERPASAESQWPGGRPEPEGNGSGQPGGAGRGAPPTLVAERTTSPVSDWLRQQYTDNLIRQLNEPPAGDHEAAGDQGDPSPAGPAAPAIPHAPAAEHAPADQAPAAPHVSAAPAAPQAPAARPAVAKYLSDVDAPRAASMTPDEFRRFATETAANNGATPEEAADYGAAQAAAFKNDDPATMQNLSRQLFQNQRQRQEQADVNQLIQNLRTARGPAAASAVPSRPPASHAPEPQPQAGPAVTRYLSDVGAPNAARMSPDDYQQFATQAAAENGATPEEAADYGAQQAAAFKNDDPASMRDLSQQLYRTQQQRQDQIDADQLMQNLRAARNSAGSGAGAARPPASRPEPQPRAANGGKGGSSANGGSSRPRPSAGGNRGAETNQPELSQPGGANSGRSAPPTTVAERTQERPSIIDQINRGLIDSIIQQVHDLPESNPPAVGGGHDTASGAGGHDSEPEPATSGYDPAQGFGPGGQDGSQQSSGGHDDAPPASNQPSAPAAPQPPGSAVPAGGPPAEANGHAPANAGTGSQDTLPEPTPAVPPEQVPAPGTVSSPRSPTPRPAGDGQPASDGSSAPAPATSVPAQPARGDSPHAPATPPAPSPTHSGGSPHPMSSASRTSTGSELPGPPGSPASSGRSMPRPATAEEFKTAIRGMLEASYIQQHVPALRDWATTADDALPYRTMIDQGNLWDHLNQREGQDATVAGGRAYVAAKSQSNIDAMTSELNHHARQDDDNSWQDGVRQRLEQAASHSVLRHYTPSSRAEQMLGGGDAGEMSSKLKLDQDTGGADHNTGDFDLQDLANHGFVFFYIEPQNNPFRDSRFAAGDGVPTRITVPVDHVAGNGWIMLNDFYDMEFPTLRSDEQGNLLSYRRDQWDDQYQEYVLANSPEARMHQALVQHVNAVRQAWDENPDLNDQAWDLAGQLARSFTPGNEDSDGEVPVGADETQSITGLLDIRQEIEQYMHDHGLDAAYAELQAQFARSVQNNVQIRRFDQDDQLLGGQSRYVFGAPDADTHGMNMIGGVDRYHEPLHNNILAGPHIATGLALRGALEIARIDAAGGHDALVERMKNMPGDQLLNLLLRSFMRPQAMIPWSVPITRDNLEHQPSRPAAPAAPPANHPSDQTAPATGPRHGAEPREHRWFDLASGVEVHSSFDVRRVQYPDGTTVTEMIRAVHVDVQPGVSPAQAEEDWRLALEGIETYINAPLRELTAGQELIQVRQVRASDWGHAHEIVTLNPFVPRAGHPDEPEHPMTQNYWLTGRHPMVHAHETLHGLGGRDESQATARTHFLKKADGNLRPITIERTATNQGSLMGDFHRPAPGGLPQATIRPRHVQQLRTFIGDPPEPVPYDSIDHTPTAGGPFTLPARTYGQAPRTPQDGEPPASSPVSSGGASSSGHSSSNPEVLGPPGSPASGRSARSQASAEQFMTAIRAGLENRFIHDDAPELRDWATGPDDALPYRTMIDQGTLWQRQNQQEGSESPHEGLTASAAGGRAYLAARSQSNVDAMRTELAGHAANEPDYDGWQETVRQRLEQAAGQSVLRHYTPSSRAEQMLGGGDDGEMKSKLKLDQETAGTAAHNTGEFDVEDLANHGFVFFYIEPRDTPFRASRFADGDGVPTRITVPIERAAGNGWIMLNDFLDMEFPTLRRADSDGNLLAYRRDQWVQANSPEAKMQETVEAIRDAWDDNPGLNDQAWDLAHQLANAFAEEHADPSGALTIGPDETEAINGLLTIGQKFEDYLHDHGLGDLYRQLQQQFTQSVRNNVQVRRFDQDHDQLLGGQSRYIHGTPGADAATMNANGGVHRYPEPLPANILAGPHIAAGLALRGTLEIARINAAGGHDQTVQDMKNMPGDQLLALLLRKFMRPQGMLPWSVPITRDDLEYQPGHSTAPPAPAAPPAPSPSLVSEPRYGDSPHAPAAPAAPTLDRPLIEDQPRQDLIRSLLDQVHEHEHEHDHGDEPERDELVAEAPSYPEFDGLDHIVLLDSGDHVYVDYQNSQVYGYDHEDDLLHPLPPEEAALIAASVLEAGEEPAPVSDNSLQRPADAVLRQHVWVDPASDAPVRSSFDVRRIDHGDGDVVTEVTVGQELVPDRDVTPGEMDETWRLIHEGDERVYNAPRHRLPDGSRLVVRTVPADRYGYVHHTVHLRRPGPGTPADAEASRVMTQKVWLIGRDPAVFAHEKGHQLGLRDESGKTSRDHPLRRSPGVPSTGAEGPVTIKRTADNHGSLLGDFTKAPPDSGLDQGGLRPRHLALLGATIGDLTDAPQETARPGDDDAAAPAAPRAPAAVDFGKTLKRSLDRYTDYRGGGLLGRVTKHGMRLRFARSKQLERSAQTLSHLSLLLHDSLRGMAQRSGPKDAANDREVQGMLINDRLLFATNFNSTIDLIRKFTNQHGQLLSLRTILQQFHENDAGARLSPAARAEYTGRLRRDYTKAMAAFDGLRGAAGDTTASTMRLGAGEPVMIVDAGSSRMHEYLTDPRYRGAVIMVRYSALDPGSRKKSEKSMHAEQKLLLALHLSGIKPQAVARPHILMGKYRPCTSCAGALAYYANQAGFGSLAFNPNYGHYYQDSTDGLIQYQSHVVRDPYYLAFMDRALSNMMSTPAGSEEQPPANAIMNNGPEVVIDPADASKRGYVTASDSEGEVTTDPWTGNKAYRSSIRNFRYQYDAGDSKGGIGKGSEQINAGRRRGGEISGDEIAKLQKRWARSTEAERERLIKSLTTESTAPLTRPYLAKVLGISESKVNRYAQGTTGHKRSNRNAEVQRRGDARGPVTDEGRGHLLREMYRLNPGFYEMWSRWRPGDSELKASSMSEELAARINQFRELYNAKSLAHELHMSVPGLNNYLNRKYGLAGQRGTGTAAVKPEPTEDVGMTDVGRAAPAAVYYPEISGYDHIIDAAGQHYYRRGSQYYLYDLQTGVLHLFRQEQPVTYQHSSGAGPSNYAAQHAYSEQMDVDEDSGSESDTEESDSESEEEYVGHGKQPVYRQQRWPQAPAAPAAARPAAEARHLTETAVGHERADQTDELAGFDEVGPSQLSAGRHGQALPVLSRGIAVGGVFQERTGQLLLDGELRGPAETADWIRQQLSYQNRPGPTVLVAGGAGAHSDRGEALARFSRAVSADLSEDVIASPGTVVQAPASEPEQPGLAEFYAGTAVIDDDGFPALVSLGSDTWFIHRPDGSTQEVGPYLTTALTRLGIGMDEPADPPTAPIQWNHDVSRPARDGRGTDVFPPTPLDTWLTAAAVVQRQGRYPLRIDTGPDTAIERYQRDQEIAALAKGIGDGTVTVTDGTVDNPDETAERGGYGPRSVGPANGEGTASAAIWTGLRGGGKKDDWEAEIKTILDRYTRYHGGGQNGRVTEQVRLRFSRSKNHERSAQTLYHLSFILHDRFRALREADEGKKSGESKKSRKEQQLDMETQGMLINGRLVFATNFNASIDRVERLRNSRDQLPILWDVLNYRAHGEGGSRGTQGQTRAEHDHRTSNTYAKGMGAIGGFRDNATADAARRAAYQRVVVVDAGSSRMREILTSPAYRDTAIMVRFGKLDDVQWGSMHAELKLLLALHLSGIRPGEIHGEHIVMGKNRPCAGCAATLTMFRERLGFRDLDFNVNNGYDFDSRTSVRRYMPDVGYHPAFPEMVERITSRRMSAPALSHARPPQDAYDNNGYETIINAADAPKVGYNTASDSDAEVTVDRAGKKVTSYVSRPRDHQYQYGEGGAQNRLGPGSSEINQHRRRGFVLGPEEESRLRQTWALATPAQQETIVRAYTKDSKTPLTHQYLSEVTGASVSTISRLSKGSTGHKRTDPDAMVRRKGPARAPLDQNGQQVLDAAMRQDPAFYRAWRGLTSDQQIGASSLSYNLAATAARLRSQYTMTSMARYLRVAGLQQHLNRQFGLAEDQPKAEPAETSIKQEPAEDVDMGGAPPEPPEYPGMLHGVYQGQHYYAHPTGRQAFYWDGTTLQYVPADEVGQVYALLTGAGPSGTQRTYGTEAMEVDDYAGAGSSSASAQYTVPASHYAPSAPTAPARPEFPDYQAHQGHQVEDEESDDESDEAPSQRRPRHKSKQPVNAWVRKRRKK